MPALRAGFNHQIGHALTETDLPAQRNDLRAQALHHLHQLEGADVRMRHIQNFFGRARLHELGHHLAAQVARVLDLAVKLAIAEGTRATFAKLHIAFGVELALAPQAPGVLGAFAHVLAALQHDGLETHLRQHQRRKNAAGAKAHHHRAQGQLGRGLAHGVPGHVGRGLDVRVAGKFFEQCGLLRGVGERDVDDVHRQQIDLARVKAALENPQRGNVGGIDQTQCLGGAGAQGGFGLGVGVGRQRGQRQPDFRKADHGLAARGYRAKGNAGEGDFTDRRMVWPACGGLRFSGTPAPEFWNAPAPSASRCPAAGGSPPRTRARCWRPNGRTGFVPDPAAPHARRNPCHRAACRGGAHGGVWAGEGVTLCTGRKKGARKLLF